VQGVIWNIFSFDQWGSLKAISCSILDELNSKKKQTITIVPLSLDYYVKNK
jgi:glucose-6-phosphate isomerase